MNQTRVMVTTLLTAEALVAAACVGWCACSCPAIAAQLWALFLCSLLCAAHFPEQSAYCRKHASSGLVLGSVALPALFAVRSETVVAVFLAFRLTWWAGISAIALRAWGRCPPLRTPAVSVTLAATILLGLAGSTTWDMQLLPALAVFITCASTMQAAMPYSFTAGEVIVAAGLCAVLCHFMLFSVLLDVVPLLVLESKLRKVITIGLFFAVAISSVNLLLSRMLVSIAGLRAVFFTRRGELHLGLTVALLVGMINCMTWAIEENSLVWVWLFVSSHTATPLKFIGYYVVVLIPALALAPASKRGSIRQVLVRKYFHVLALVLFVPTILINIRFMALAFAVAIAVFMVIESLRISDVPQVVAVVDPFMNRYRDDRDEGTAVLSHMYLLMGCALPVFFAYFMHRGIFSATSLLVALSGVAVTGLGDAAASYCGINFGRHHWPGSKKTLEGTAAMVFSVLLFQSFCLVAVGFQGLSLASWGRLVLADVLVALLEANTDQIDNLFLPLFHVALLQMV